MQSAGRTRRHRPCLHTWRPSVSPSRRSGQGNGNGRPLAGEPVPPSLSWMSVRPRSHPLRASSWQGVLTEPALVRPVTPLPARNPSGHCSPSPTICHRLQSPSVWSRRASSQTTTTRRKRRRGSRRPFGGSGAADRGDSVSSAPSRSSQRRAALLQPSARYVPSHPRGVVRVASYASRPTRVDDDRIVVVYGGRTSSRSPAFARPNMAATKRALCTEGRGLHTSPSTGSTGPAGNVTPRAATGPTARRIPARSPPVS